MTIERKNGNIPSSLYEVVEIDAQSIYCKMANEEMIKFSGLKYSM